MTEAQILYSHRCLLYGIICIFLCESVTEMRSRPIPVLATLIVAAIVAVAPVPVLAQDSTVRPQSAAVFVPPAERQSASQPPTTDQSPVMEAQRDRVDWPRVGMGVTVAVGNLFYIPAKVAYG